MMPSPMQLSPRAPGEGRLVEKCPESGGNAPWSPWAPTVLRAWLSSPQLGRDAGGLGEGFAAG